MDIAVISLCIGVISTLPIFHTIFVKVKSKLRQKLKRNKNTISWKEIEEIRQNSYRRRAEERIIERAVTKYISKHI